MGVDEVTPVAGVSTDHATKRPAAGPADPAAAAPPPPVVAIPDDGGDAPGLTGNDRHAAGRLERRPPGAYPHVQRTRRGGGIETRYRTHMGQLCRPDTTPAEAVAMWEARLEKIRTAPVVGRKHAERLAAVLSPE